MKTCTTCKQEKPLDNFHKTSRSKDGLSWACKDCLSAANKKYREDNAESIKEKKREYRLANKEKIYESQKRSVLLKLDHYLAYQKEYSFQNKERIREKASVYYHSNKEAISIKTKKERRDDPVPRMLNSAKQRAKKKGMDFSITMEDVEMNWICPILHCPISVADNAKTRYSPSLDRLDSTKGYVPGNVWVISDLANTMKNNATEVELILFAKWILEGSNFNTDEFFEYKGRSRLLTQLKGRAKKQDLEFNLEIDDLIFPKVCPVFGTEFSRGFLGSRSEHEPSVDKIDPMKGYVKGNIQMISKKANIMKHKATQDELFLFAVWVFEAYLPEYLDENAEWLDAKKDMMCEEVDL